MNMLEYLKCLTLSPGKREPFTILLSRTPLYYILPLVSLIYITAHLKKRYGKKISLLFISYFPFATAILFPNDMLFFFPFFMNIYIKVTERREESAPVLSALSSFTRIDGILLTILSSLSELKKRKFRKVLVAFAILLIYLATAYAVFGNPIHHLAINTSKTSGFLNTTAFLKRIHTEPFTVLSGAIGFVLILLALLLEKSVLKFYFLALLLVGVLNLQALVECGRWGAPQAAFALVNKKNFKKFAEKNFHILFTLSIIYSVVFLFLRVRFLSATICR